MKIKKVTSFIAGGFLYIVLALFLVGYGNKENHPTINDFIVDAFLSKNNMGQFSMNKFKQYRFMFDIEKFTGDGITKEGLFHPAHSPAPGNHPISYFEEGKMSLTARGWIKHGGMSADVPEVPASLRHFYDPTMPDGQRYLQDKANGRLMAFAQSLLPNPKIDHAEWAIGKPGVLGTEEHIYTWENGKLWIRGALETNDEKKRKEFMAKAWRALGETLHYIADNGCPSHVRDDAHPSPLWDYNNIFGNPDPYEEWMSIIQKENKSEFLAFAHNYSARVETGMQSLFRELKTAKEIGHELALWTNRNFFTTETISGRDWKGNEVIPLTHPEKVYASPKLHNMTYSNYYYTNSIAGHGVIHCTDLTYYAKIIPVRGYPYIDKESVRSQATVLIPHIIEAGMNAIKLFIPEIEVEINEAKNGTIKGTITHKPDSEYKSAIKYNGKVKVIIKGSDYKIKKEVFCDAQNGNFEAQGLVFSEGDLAFAEIEFGGIMVEAKEFNVTPDNDILAQLLRTTRFGQNLSGIEVTYEDIYKFNGNIENSNTYIREISVGLQTGEINAGQYDIAHKPLIWGGNTCSLLWDTVRFDKQYSYHVMGTASANGEAIQNFSWKVEIKLYKESTGSDGTIYKNEEESITEIELSNIPLKSWLTDYGVFYESTGNINKQKVVNFRNYTRTFESRNTGNYTETRENIKNSKGFNLKSDARLSLSFWI